MNPSVYGEYVDEDLPLPSFQEVFGFALHVTDNAATQKKRAFTARVDSRSAKKAKENIDETTG